MQRQMLVQDRSTGGRAYPPQHHHLSRQPWQPCRRPAPPPSSHLLHLPLHLHLCTYQLALSDPVRLPPALPAPSPCPSSPTPPPPLLPSPPPPPTTPTPSASLPPPSPLQHHLATQPSRSPRRPLRCRHLKPHLDSLHPSLPNHARHPPSPSPEPAPQRLPLPPPLRPLLALRPTSPPPSAPPTPTLPPTLPAATRPPPKPPYPPLQQSPPL